MAVYCLGRFDGYNVLEIDVVSEAAYRWVEKHVFPRRNDIMCIAREMSDGEDFVAYVVVEGDIHDVESIVTSAMTHMAITGVQGVTASRAELPDPDDWNESEAEK